MWAGTLPESVHNSKVARDVIVELGSLIDRPFKPAPLHLGWYFTSTILGGNETM
jgi:hypothetical protein